MKGWVRTAATDCQKIIKKLKGPEPPESTGRRSRIAKERGVARTARKKVGTRTAEKRGRGPEPPVRREGPDRRGKLGMGARTAGDDGGGGPESQQ